MAQLEKPMYCGQVGCPLCLMAVNTSEANFPRKLINLGEGRIDFDTREEMILGFSLR